MIFQALEPLQPQWPLQPQQPQWPQWPRQPHFIKKITDPDVEIIPTTQMIKTIPFFWNGSSKIHFLLISDTLPVGGCWGQLMLLFWKVVVEPKNSLSQHSRSIFKPSLTCIFYPSEPIHKVHFKMRHPVEVKHSSLKCYYYLHPQIFKPSARNDMADVCGHVFCNNLESLLCFYCFRMH